jgi:hypothetical protein
MKATVVRAFICSSFILLFLSNHTNAQVKGAFAGVEIGDSLVQITGKLKDKCKKQRLVTKILPRFPLANKSEKHFICEGIAVAKTTIAKVVFTLADDKVVLISSKGNAAKALSSKTTSKEIQFLGLRVFRDELAFASKKADTFTILSKEAVHPHLFVWENPFLENDAEFEYEYRKSAERPSFIRFGSTFDDLKPEFEKACPLILIEKEEKPFLPSKPKKQIQINCFGYEYAGFPRKFEAVFGDGKLQMVWILTAQPEEARVRTELKKAFGDQIFESETWEAFDNWKIYLRKDKPEVLMISEELIKFFKPQITGK